MLQAVAHESELKIVYVNQIPIARSPSPLVIYTCLCRNNEVALFSGKAEQLGSPTHVPLLSFSNVTTPGLVLVNLVKESSYVNSPVT